MHRKWGFYCFEVSVMFQIEGTKLNGFIEKRQQNLVKMVYELIAP